MGKNFPHSNLFEALKNFSDSVNVKFTARTHGQPEAQLKAPVEQLFFSYNKSTPQKLILKNESMVGRLGRPDYAVESDGLLIGYIKLKEPDKGADTRKFKSHDAEQWERLKNIPNIIYCSGNEWALYQNHELSGKLVRMSGDVCSEGRKAITESNAKDLFSLLGDFISWTPIVPKKPKEARFVPRAILPTDPR